MAEPAARCPQRRTVKKSKTKSLPRMKRESPAGALKRAPEQEECLGASRGSLAHRRTTPSPLRFFGGLALHRSRTFLSVYARFVLLWTSRQSITLLSLPTTGDDRPLASLFPISLYQIRTRGEVEEEEPRRSSGSFLRRSEEIYYW